MSRLPRVCKPIVSDSDTAQQGTHYSQVFFLFLAGVRVGARQCQNSFYLS